MRLPARRTACSKQALLTGPSSRDRSVYLSPSFGAAQLGRKEMKISVNMRTVLIISCIALLAFNALSLFTAASRFHSYFSGGSLVVALALRAARFCNRPWEQAAQRQQRNASRSGGRHWWWYLG